MRGASPNCTKVMRSVGMARMGAPGERFEPELDVEIAGDAAQGWGKALQLQSTVRRGPMHSPARGNAGQASGGAAASARRRSSWDNVRPTKMSHASTP